MTQSVTDLWMRAAERLQRAGIESPALEAQLLVGMALGLSRIEILAGREMTVSAEQTEELERLVRARENRVPLAYLRGTQEFYGLTFEVSPAVLIPRPETELLVELALGATSGLADATVVDVGTGSGCILITIAHSRPEVRCIAVDISPDALEIARRNAELNGVADRIELVHGDMLDTVDSCSVELVVSNPPYIPTGDISSLQAEVRDYEPRLALDAGVDGFSFHRRLIDGARRVLKTGGTLGIEVALEQAPDVVAMMSQAGFKDVWTRKDLAGIERIVVGTLPEG